MDHPACVAPFVPHAGRLGAARGAQRRRGLRGDRLRRDPAPRLGRRGRAAGLSGARPGGSLPRGLDTRKPWEKLGGSNGLKIADLCWCIADLYIFICVNLCWC